MRIKHLFLVISLALIFISVDALEIKTGFSHENKNTGRVKAIDLIKEFIQKQKKRVYVLAYELTNVDIIQWISEKAKAGLDVRVIQDNKTANRNKTLSTDFLKAGVIYRKNAEYAIMHNKVIIGDDGNLLTGSFNFSKNAVQRNAENVIVLYDMPMMAWNDYMNEFKLLEKESK